MVLSLTVDSDTGIAFMNLCLYSVTYSCTVSREDNLQTIITLLTPNFCLAAGGEAGIANCTAMRSMDVANCRTLLPPPPGDFGGFTRLTNPYVQYRDCVETAETEYLVCMEPYLWNILRGPW